MYHVVNIVVADAAEDGSVVGYIVADHLDENPVHGNATEKDLVASFATDKPEEDPVADTVADILEECPFVGVVTMYFGVENATDTVQENPAYSV